METNLLEAQRLLEQAGLFVKKQSSYKDNTSYLLGGTGIIPGNIPVVEHSFMLEWDQNVFVVSISGPGLFGETVETPVLKTAIDFIIMVYKNRGLLNENF